MTTALPILLLSDGRPGHFNLSQGIADAIGLLRPVAVTRIEVSRGRWPGAVVAAWSNAGMAPATLLRTVYGCQSADLPQAALVVSAGAETLGASVACAQLLGAANIFYGSLRWFRPERFNLVLTSYQSQASRRHHALALKPSPAAHIAWSQRTSPLQRPPRQIALLVGGSSGESTFTDRDWQRLFHLIEEVSAWGHRWLITNSRRTPHSVSDRLRELAGRPASPITRYIDVRDGAPFPLGHLLAASDAALVTDESSSMVSDAVAAGLPVLGLVPDRQVLTANEQGYRATLADNGWYRAVPLDGLGPAVMLAGLAELNPMTSDPQSTLAALLANRLPQLCS